MNEWNNENLHLNDLTVVLGFVGKISAKIMTPSSKVYVFERYEINKSNSFMRLFSIYSASVRGQRSLCGFSFEPLTSSSYIRANILWGHGITLFLQRITTNHQINGRNIGIGWPLVCLQYKKYGQMKE